MDLKGKGMEMLLRSVIASLGIDADSLLTNINQFQGWVTNAIQHHDKRLIALEQQGKENGEKLDRILAILESLFAERVDCFGSDIIPLTTGISGLPVQYQEAHEQAPINIPTVIGE